MKKLQLKRQASRTKRIKKILVKSWNKQLKAATRLTKLRGKK